MNEKQRAEFEKWASRHHGTSSIGKVGEHYSNSQVNNDWFVWQAAIASVVVELPARMRGIDEQCRINNKAVDMMQQKLNEAGIRYE